jgi:YfiH family protein
VIPFIEPQWPAPPSVRAIVTTRTGGSSLAGYADFNLATHVGDDPARVAANRALLRQTLQLPAEPSWLNQIHGAECVDASLSFAQPPAADAAFASKPGAVCAVLTADCLPILLCDRAGSVVAAVHAGWRGLANGVIPHAVSRLTAASELIAWVGPGIGPRHYRVGPDLRERFIERDRDHARAFETGPDGDYANLALIAEQQLLQSGVSHVTLSGLCTFEDAARFYSFRREAVCGRFASLIWIESSPAIA